MAASTISQLRVKTLLQNVQDADTVHDLADAFTHINSEYRKNVNGDLFFEEGLAQVIVDAMNSHDDVMYKCECAEMISDKSYHATQFIDAGALEALVELIPHLTGRLFNVTTTLTYFMHFDQNTLVISQERFQRLRDVPRVIEILGNAAGKNLDHGNSANLLKDLEGISPTCRNIKAAST